jgi:hypothetical protein
VKAHVRIDEPDEKPGKGVNSVAVLLDGRVVYLNVSYGRAA